MTTPTKFYIHVNIQISNEQWASGGVQIQETVPTRTLTFKEMAEVLEAFHVLIEKFRET